MRQDQESNGRDTAAVVALSDAEVRRRKTQLIRPSKSPWPISKRSIKRNVNNSRMRLTSPNNKRRDRCA